MSGTKQPVSVLVVIYTSNMEVLLLERTDHANYWQSVTGSREGDETLRDTAIREVLEETSLDANQYQLADWQLQNNYEIYPHWRHRYAAGITQNTEHVFGLQLPDRLSVRLAPREHLNFQWQPVQAAADKVFSPSNQAAILQLTQRVSRKTP
jgi:dATP pyrophosphohydrolase